MRADAAPTKPSSALRSIIPTAAPPVTPLHELPELVTGAKYSHAAQAIKAAPMAIKMAAALPICISTGSWKDTGSTKIQRQGSTVAGQLESKRLLRVTVATRNLMLFGKHWHEFMLVDDDGVGGGRPTLEKEPSRSHDHTANQAAYDQNTQHNDEDNCGDGRVGFLAHDKRSLTRRRLGWNQ